MPPNQLALTWLLNYEIRSSVRYRRCLSLVVLGGQGFSTQRDMFLESDLRKSDEVFRLCDKVAVLMGETPREGALSAVNRLKEQLTDATSSLCCGIASFPADGDDTKTLMYCAFRRCQDARMQGSGSVVWHD